MLSLTASRVIPALIRNYNGGIGKATKVPPSRLLRTTAGSELGLIQLQRSAGYRSCSADRHYHHNLVTTEHLIALHCHIPAGAVDPNVTYRQLQKSLLSLFRRGLVIRPKVVANQPRPYGITARGRALVAEHWNLPPRRFDTRYPSDLHRVHALGTTNFMVNDELSCRARGGVRLLHTDEIREHTSPEFQKDGSWPVTIKWEGSELKVWLKPDRVYGHHHLSRPAGENRRYFALEIDNGTMPITRSSIHQSSIMRKDIA